MKTCTSCKRTWSLSCFHRSAPTPGHPSKDGRHSHCKYCRARKDAARWQRLKAQRGTP